ncbi:MAG TPA: hypothetical protein VK805_17115 [Candidatus Baltobacteraceae bacterium]|jgi:hypothetical protein|nr:hypothetical protein [Candidatus Baltobacteraceae bacterium]
MRDPIRLDRVFLFQDQLNFLIPHDWLEGESEDSEDYLYHAPETDSGWLRVSLITLKLGNETPDERLLRLQANWLEDSNVAVYAEEESGNIIKKWEKDSIENGDLIHVYHWCVANTVPPNFVMEAVFTYSILDTRKAEPETIETVELVEQLVGIAKFAPRALIQ